MALNPDVNIVYGNNAQGKTNILEALYVCATTRSHKGSRDREMISFGCDEAHIKSIIEKNDTSYRIDMHLKKNKSKGIAINGVSIKKASELFGIINIIFFSPEDLNIIKNGPSERRRFLDMELCQLDKIYLHNLTNYNKILIQRNKLLKDMNYFNSAKDTLEIWNMQLVRYGCELIKRRRQFIRDLNDIVGKIHSQLSGETEELLLTYEEDVSEDLFMDTLNGAFEKELKLKSTWCGPHKDDMGFQINGIDVRKYGSQGQQRTAALSLKMAEIELVKSIIKDTPVLFLDDVLSELDSNRQYYLLNSIKNIQTIITCTGLEEFVNNRFHIDKIYKVVSGKVTCEN
jgi:DNA replication and repair protein RecF